MIRHIWSASWLSFVLTCALLIQAGLVSAQEPITVLLQPVADSGVSGTAMLTSGEGGDVVNVDIAGLAPDTSYRALLQAGTCDSPSASFGELGTLEPDPEGAASLVAGTARMSAAGASIDLVVSNLTDGDHIISIVGPGIIACGSIPAAERQ